MALVSFACVLTMASLAACAGNDSLHASDVVRVTATEMHFTPSRLVALAGKERVEIHNRGALTHTFSLNDIGEEVTVAPGKTKTIHLTLTPGKYRYVCRILDHEGLGMHGVLTVRAS